MTDLAEKIARVIDPVAWLNEVMRPFDWEARQKVSTDKASAILALLEPEGWQPIDTAPKDGTKIDLLYPYPRGRTAKRSTAIWASMDDMLAIHGHPEYGSELIWHDEFGCTTTPPQSK